MIKEFFLKQALNQALKGADVPEEQKQMLLNMVMKDPALFQKIAEEAQVLMKEKGIDQMAAVMQVSKKYENELKGLAK